MIYNKDANFPYPILKNGSISYKDSYFILDVTLEENTNYYRISFTYEISSPFIEKLIFDEKAMLILIIQSKDNKFYKLNSSQRFIDVPKSRISFGNRTSIQLHIQSNTEIRFDKNDDLTSFYDEFKDDLVVPKNSLLGFSNIVVWEGSMQKPLELFEKKLNENLSSEIKIELGTETIIIHYKKADYQLGEISNKALNNLYIYMGLRTGLMRFITFYGEDGDDYVDLSEINPPENLLDFKLYQLMKSKFVKELHFDLIDEVITQISDKIIEKYTSAVKELASNGN